MAAKGDINKFKIQPELKPEWNIIDFENALEKTSIAYKLKSTDYNSEGVYPVIDQSSKLISGYIDDSALLYKGELPVVVFGDHTRNIKFIDFEFGVGADGTKILKPKKNINSKFFYYYIKCLQVPDFGYSRHYSIFKILDFPVPPLAEQERIVAKLDALFAQQDVMKKALSRIPDLLKDFRQQVLTQAVTGKLTERWREGKELNFTYDLKIEDIHARKLNPIKLRGKDFFENAASLYTLPPSWKWVRLYKLVKDEKNSICAGPFGTIFKAKDFKETGIPIIFLKHVKKEGFNFKKPVYMDEEVWEKFHKDYTVNGGELLVTKLGDPPGEATIFPVDFGIAMVTPDVMKANIDNNIILTKFVSYFFNSSSTKEIISEISFGMTRLRIDLGMFKAMPIPTPNFDEQKEIVLRVESLFDKADVIEQRYKTLKEKIDQLPQSLLHKAFQGELVEQLPTDGDAKDLLKEILALKKEGTKK